MSGQPQSGRPCVIFDDRRGQLAPLNDLRPSFLVRTGAFTTLERHRHDSRLHIEAALMPEAFVLLGREMSGLPTAAILASESPVLLINGRCPLLPEGVTALAPGQAIMESATGDVIACVVPCSRARTVIDSPESLQLDRHAIDGLWLIARPWHVRTLRDRAIAHDLKLLVPTHHRHEWLGRDKCCVVGKLVDLRLHSNIILHGGVIFDTEHGLVVVDEGANIRPGARLIGPCYIGPHCTVMENATIRPNTAIGPWCKANGEISGTIFQGFSNKAHDGYLGDSWVGEWCNFGAGTTNSNLLNTYGEIIAQASPGGRHERTGENFLGAVIGDHTKFAICTRVMTGAVLHTGGMFATTTPVSGCARPFTWATDAGTRPYRFDKFVEVMRAAMERRKINPSDAYLRRLNAVHAAAMEGWK